MACRSLVNNGNSFGMLNVNAPKFAAANVFARIHSADFDAGLRQLLATNAQRFPRVQ